MAVSSRCRTRCKYSRDSWICAAMASNQDFYAVVMCVCGHSVRISLSELGPSRSQIENFGGVVPAFAVFESLNRAPYRREEGSQ